jgi:hypothetical protein
MKKDFVLYNLRKKEIHKKWQDHFNQILCYSGMEALHAS